MVTSQLTENPINLFPTTTVGLLLKAKGEKKIFSRSLHSLRYMIVNCGSEPTALKITDDFILALSVERVHTTSGGEIRDPSPLP